MRADTDTTYAGVVLILVLMPLLTGTGADVLIMLGGITEAAEKQDAAAAKGYVSKACQHGHTLRPGSGRAGRLRLEAPSRFRTAHPWLHPWLQSSARAARDMRGAM